MIQGWMIMNWHNAAKQYLERLGLGEYEEQLAQHVKARRSKNTFRYCPTDYHSQLIELLGQDDEEEFKALKMLQGYASGIGV